jgi:hypothetical protein
MLNLKETAVGNPLSNHYKEPEDITIVELKSYLKANKIDPVYLLCELLNGYNQTHLVFDDIRS